MIRIEDTEVMGLRGALRGMRNPMNSWKHADSEWVDKPVSCLDEDEAGWINQRADAFEHTVTEYDYEESIYSDGDSECYERPEEYVKYFKVGEKDLDLAKRLCKAGSEHRKFLQMVHVQCDIVAPKKWWSHADTYRFIVKNSCSSMHKGHETDVDDPETFSEENFIAGANIPIDNMVDMNGEPYTIGFAWQLWKNMIKTLERKYDETKDKLYWDILIDALPNCTNVRRTLDVNYETLINIYRQRRGHKLKEWQIVCDWIENLPYMRYFLIAAGLLEK